MSKYVKELFFGLYFLLFCHSIIGQSKVDSLSYYRKIENYHKGIVYGEKNKQLLINQNKINISEYPILLLNLGICYQNEGDYVKAEVNYLQSIEFFQKISEKSRPNYLTALNQLASLYFEKGDYNIAEVRLLQILKLQKEILVENHPDYLFTLNCLGTLYLTKKDYINAEIFLLRSLELGKKILGEKDSSYTRSLYDLAELYQKEGDYSKSEPLYLQLLAIMGNVSEENYPEYYATALNNLGLLYFSQREYTKAEPLYLKSFAISKKNLGEDYSDNLAIINNLALLYSSQREYAKAEPLYLQSLAIKEKLLGENHPDYAISLDNLALLYNKKEEYTKAEPLFLQSLSIKENVLGEKHPDYAISLFYLARLYSNQGEYSKAEQFYLKSLEISKDALGEDHPDYITSLNDLAVIYLMQGKYSKAEPLFLQELKIKKKVLGENHPEYATTLNNLAGLYQGKGEYSKSEQLYLQSITIRKKILGENHPAYANALNNLALLYEDQGEYSKAELLFLQTLKIRKDVLGENHSDYAISLESLAGIYHKKREYSKSEQLYLQSLTINKKVLGENHPNYASSLNSLGLLYMSQGEYSKAEPLFLQSLAIDKKVLGENHPFYASQLNNLAGLHQENGEYSKSEPLFLQSLVIRKKVLGENHPDYATTLNNLALFYQLYNIKLNNKKVSNYFQSGFSPFQHQIIEASTYLSENELRLFRLDKFSNRFLPLSFLHRYPSQYSTINIGCYENELLVKNLSLRNQQRIGKSIQKSGDTALKEKYEQFVSDKRQINKLSELPLDKRPTNYQQLTSETELLEKELVRSSSVFLDAKNALSVNWKQVQEKLKPNEIAIDVVAFNYYNKKWKDSIVYAAFVVDKNFKVPKYIPLFEQKQLEFLLAKNKNEKDNDRIDKQYSNKAISDLFLKPLAKELENATTIYLSPSGLGNQIDFSALPVSESQTLGDKYSVHILGSTSEIVNYKVAHLDQKTKLELLLYGNIDYNKSAATNKVLLDTLTNNYSELAALTSRSSATAKFEYLAGSKTEINKINDFAKQNNFASAIIDDKKATEESIKHLDGRIAPYVLHLATHGFFFPDPKQELLKEDLLSDSKSKIYKTADDPMMRSGLLFAGANKYWGKPTENLTTDDGILTASEISNLDLSACQLVVLSACETGLGEINGSEGVFGLQRAFKIAGVKNIIMSLWKVPDAQTAELFDVFYTECFTGKTIHEAFQTAQAKMKANYSPYYWAGFVLLE